MRPSKSLVASVKENEVDGEGRKFRESDQRRGTVAIIWTCGARTRREVSKKGEGTTLRRAGNDESAKREEPL